VLTLHRWNRIGVAALFAGGTLAAQQASEPRFEVVSLRTLPRDGPTIMRDIDFTPILPGGRYVNSYDALTFMIGFAYNVKNYSKLVGLPNWAREQSYSVAAQPSDSFPILSPAENIEQVRLMMRGMLADRFHLQMHTESRQEPIFNLEVAKGGLRIKEVAPPVPPSKEGRVGLALGDEGGRMIGVKATMQGIVAAVDVWVGRPVVDRTGLAGYYDFDVKWASQDCRAGPGLGADGIALLLSNLQDQFGLHLASANGPVEYWVVDHVEPPTEN
jgi:uncharacterized protein (TIGR03435 family)